MIFTTDLDQTGKIDSTNISFKFNGASVAVEKSIDQINSQVYYTIPNITSDGVVSIHGLDYAEDYYKGNDHEAGTFDDIYYYHIDPSNMSEMEMINFQNSGNFLEDNGCYSYETGMYCSFGGIWPKAGKKITSVKICVSPDKTNYVDTEIELSNTYVGYNGVYDIDNQNLNFIVNKGENFWEIAYSIEVLLPESVIFIRNSVNVITTIPITSELFIKPVVATENYYVPIDLKIRTNYGSIEDISTDASIQINYDATNKALTLVKDDWKYIFTNIYKIGNDYYTIYGKEIGYSSNQSTDICDVYIYDASLLPTNYCQLLFNDWGKQVIENELYIYSATPCYQSGVNSDFSMNILLAFEEN